MYGSDLTSSMMRQKLMDVFAEASEGARTAQERTEASEPGGEKGRGRSQKLRSHAQTLVLGQAWHGQDGQTLDSLLIPYTHPSHWLSSLFCCWREIVSVVISLSLHKSLEKVFVVG